MLSDVKNGENIGMVERGHSARLLFEAAQAVGFEGKKLRENLQRDLALEARISGAIHFPHAAGAKRGLNLIGAEF